MGAFGRSPLDAQVKALEELTTEKFAKKVRTQFRSYNAMPAQPFGELTWCEGVEGWGCDDSMDW